MDDVINVSGHRIGTAEVRPTRRGNLSLLARLRPHAHASNLYCFAGQSPRRLEVMRASPRVQPESPNGGGKEMITSSQAFRVLRCWFCSLILRHCYVFCISMFAKRYLFLVLCVCVCVNRFPHVDDISYYCRVHHVRKERCQHLNNIDLVQWDRSLNLVF